jgi:hypothetical protein
LQSFPKKLAAYQDRVSAPMARIRTIKPEFFTSADSVSLSPLARLFYVSLWCQADREGRLKWNAETLKMRCLPADDCDINELANELVSRGMIILYHTKGMDLCFIPTFSEHQVINNREGSSILPEYDDDQKTVTRESGVNTRESGREGRKGKEGKGKETSSDCFFEDQEINTKPESTFDDWYKHYPKKVGRGQAEKAYKSAIKDVPFDQLVSATKAYSDLFEGKPKDYIKHPATWLNGKCWLDEGISNAECNLDSPQAKWGDAIDRWQKNGKQGPMPSKSDYGVPE